MNLPILCIIHRPGWASRSAALLGLLALGLGACGDTPTDSCTARLPDGTRWCTEDKGLSADLRVIFQLECEGRSGADAGSRAYAAAGCSRAGAVAGCQVKLWDTNTSTAYSAALWYFDGYSAQSAVYDCVNRGGTVVNP